MGDLGRGNHGTRKGLLATLNLSTLEEEQGGGWKSSQELPSGHSQEEAGAGEAHTVRGLVDGESRGPREQCVTPIPVFTTEVTLENSSLRKNCSMKNFSSIFSHFLISCIFVSIMLP